MSGSKGGSKMGSQPDDDIAARISASIGAGQSNLSRSHSRPASETGAASLKTPRPVVVKSIKTLAPQKPSSPAGQEDPETDKLPAALDEGEFAGFSPDWIWGLTAFVVIGLLVGSGLVFMMLIQNPANHDPRPRSNPIPSGSVEVTFSGQPPIMVGDGNIPTPTPLPTPTPEPSRSFQPNNNISQSPALESLPPPSLAPAASLAPPPRGPLLTPPPLRPPSIKAPTPIKPAVPAVAEAYQVLVGPFETRNDADSSSTDLADLGKPIKVQQEKDKFWLLMGDPYPKQDDALGMAEQVVQRGKQVIVKKK